MTVWTVWVFTVGSAWEKLADFYDVSTMSARSSARYFVSKCPEGKRRRVRVLPAGEVPKGDPS